MTLTSHISSNERIPVWIEYLIIDRPDGSYDECVWIIGQDITHPACHDCDCSYVTVDTKYYPSHDAAYTRGPLYGWDDGVGYNFGFGYGYGYGYRTSGDVYDVDIVTDIYIDTEDMALGDYNAKGYVHAFGMGTHGWGTNEVGFEVYRYYNTVGGTSNGYQPRNPNVYDVNGDLVETGEADLTGLVVGDVFTWTIDGESHSGKVLSVGAGYAVIQISSDPQDVKVLVGETKQVDVDGDGIMDIAVTLSSITSGKANVKIVDLTWTTPPAAEMPPAATPGAQPGVPPTGQPGTQPGTQPAADYTLITAIVVILIVVVALGYMAKKKKKK
jgi:hypothetical protein